MWRRSGYGEVSSQPRPIREVFLILSPGRHFRRMPLLQWIVLWAIGLVPVLLLPILPISITVGTFDLPIRDPAYGLWILCVLGLVPIAFRKDRSRAEQNVDLRLEGPQRDIQRLKDELEQTKTDLQGQKEQLAEMDRVMRIGFAQVDGVTIPSRRMALQVSWGFDLPQPTVTLVPHAGRFKRWVIRPAVRFGKWFGKWFKG